MRLGVAVVLGMLHGCERVHKTEEPDAPMAVVFVMEGDAFWIGNDSYESEPNNQYQGALISFEHGIDKLDLVRHVPTGTRVGIVTYADRSSVRLPLSPVTQLHGSSFGMQVDYKGSVGGDVVKGIETGLDELARSKAPAKLMVVIGQELAGYGSEAAVAAARQPLAELKQRAATMNVSIESLRFHAPEWVPTVRISDAAMQASSEDGVADALGKFVDKHTPRAGRE